MTSMSRYIVCVKTC